MRTRPHTPGPRRRTLQTAPECFRRIKRASLADRGPAPNDARHRLVATGIVLLPFGCQAATLISARTALPYNVTLGSTNDRNHDGVFNDRPEGQGRNDARGSAFFQADVRIAKTVACGPAAHSIAVRGASTSPIAPTGRTTSATRVRSSSGSPVAAKRRGSSRSGSTRLRRRHAAMILASGDRLGPYEILASARLQAAWGRSTGPAIRASIASWRSRCCRPSVAENPGRKARASAREASGDLAAQPSAYLRGVTTSARHERNSAFLVMEFIDGETLARTATARAARRGRRPRSSGRCRWPPRSTRRHRRGLVHRDLEASEHHG